MKKAVIIPILFLLTTTAVSPGEPADREKFFVMKATPIIQLKGYDAELSFYESSHNPAAINSIGAMGLFGFMRTTLLSLGYDIDPEVFRITPEIFSKAQQIEALWKYTQQNDSILREQIIRYSGTVINDSIRVTRAGILAAAHLGGPGAVQNFFETGYVAKDKNGTDILRYMWLFMDVEIRRM